MERFPYSSDPDDIPYDDLDNLNKIIVNRHLRMAGSLKMWEDITTWLIKEIHNKKSMIIRKKYMPTDSITKYYYDKYLFKGGKQLSSFDVFPSTFQSSLEQVLIRELSTKFNFPVVYYRHKDKPNELKYSDFDKNEWQLSEGFEMNSNDICVMEKYKEEFIKFLDSCVSLIETFNNTGRSIYEHNRVKKERDRIVKVMNYC
jgi:hypothetical protein